MAYAVGAVVVILLVMAAMSGRKSPATEPRASGSVSEPDLEMRVAVRERLAGMGFAPDGFTVVKWEPARQVLVARHKSAFAGARDIAALNPPTGFGGEFFDLTAGTMIAVAWRPNSDGAVYDNRFFVADSHVLGDRTARDFPLLSEWLAASSAGGRVTSAVVRIGFFTEGKALLESGASSGGLAVDGVPAANSARLGSYAEYLDVPAGTYRLKVGYYKVLASGERIDRLGGRFSGVQSPLTIEVTDKELIQQFRLDVGPLAD